MSESQSAIELYLYSIIISAVLRRRKIESVSEAPKVLESVAGTAAQRSGTGSGSFNVDGRGLNEGAAPPLKRQRVFSLVMDRPLTSAGSPKEKKVSPSGNQSRRRLLLVHKMPEGGSSAGPCSTDLHAKGSIGEAPWRPPPQDYVLISAVASCPHDTVIGVLTDDRAVWYQHSVTEGGDLNDIGGTVGGAKTLLEGCTTLYRPLIPLTAGMTIELFEDPRALGPVCEFGASEGDAGSFFQYQWAYLVSHRYRTVALVSSKCVILSAQLVPVPPCAPRGPILTYHPQSLITAGSRKDGHGKEVPPPCVPLNPSSMWARVNDLVLEAEFVGRTDVQTDFDEVTPDDAALFRDTNTIAQGCIRDASGSIGGLFANGKVLAPPLFGTRLYVRALVSKVAGLAIAWGTFCVRLTRIRNSVVATKAAALQARASRQFRSVADGTRMLTTRRRSLELQPFLLNAEQPLSDPGDAEEAEKLAIYKIFSNFFTTFEGPDSSLSPTIPEDLVPPLTVQILLLLCPMLVRLPLPVLEYVFEEAALGWPAQLVFFNEAPSRSSVRTRSQNMANAGLSAPCVEAFQVLREIGFLHTVSAPGVVRGEGVGGATPVEHPFAFVEGTAANAAINSSHLALSLAPDFLALLTKSSQGVETVSLSGRLTWALKHAPLEIDISSCYPLSVDEAVLLEAADEALYAFVSCACVSHESGATDTLDAGGDGPEGTERAPSVGSTAPCKQNSVEYLANKLPQPVDETSDIFERSIQVQSRVESRDAPVTPNEGEVVQRLCALAPIDLLRMFFILCTASASGVLLSLAHYFGSSDRWTFCAGSSLETVVKAWSSNMVAAVAAAGTFHQATASLQGHDCVKRLQAAATFLKQRGCSDPTSSLATLLAHFVFLSGGSNLNEAVASMSLMLIYHYGPYNRKGDLLPGTFRKSLSTRPATAERVWGGRIDIEELSEMKKLVNVLTFSGGLYEDKIVTLL